MDVVKLYRRQGAEFSYWEAWENEGKIVVHRGKVGEDGDMEDMKATKSAREKVEAARKMKVEEGYAPIPEEDMAVLVIEYKIDGAGDAGDPETRQGLEDQMDDTLGWTGLGHCEGIRAGDGIMAVDCTVVDFEIAKKVIEEDLKGTGFAGFERIYREEG